MIGYQIAELIAHIFPPLVRDLTLALQAINPLPEHGFHRPSLAPVDGWHRRLFIGEVSSADLFQLTGCAADGFGYLIQQLGLGLVLSVLRQVSPAAFLFGHS